MGEKCDQNLQDLEQHWEKEMETTCSLLLDCVVVVMVVVVVVVVVVVMVVGWCWRKQQDLSLKC